MKRKFGLRIALIALTFAISITILLVRFSPRVFGITIVPSVRDQTNYIVRTRLAAADLFDGFDFASPQNESVFAVPEDAMPPRHIFQGRLELVGERSNGETQSLRGRLESEDTYLPEFDFEFVQSGGHIIPKERGLIITKHPSWNYILEPGRVWQESGDGDYTRASFPFALVLKGNNAIFNGTMTFLFDDEKVSRVWYQITQETTFVEANFWGLLNAKYYPGPVDGTEQLTSKFTQELANRFPTRPIEQLAQDYPGVDLAAFGNGVSPEHMTWYGFIIDGVNYVGGCQTRYGYYFYCESMRTSSYSTSKSAFVSLALMRLAQKYGAVAENLFIKDYVPEYASSAGNWEQVSFGHVIDMATGNYISLEYMEDENGEQMGRFYGTQPYVKRITAAFDWPHAEESGTRWVYHTSDTFILTRAMHNYLREQEGDNADIFQFVVDEIYKPLRLSPGAYTTMRTSDDKWQGQAEGGYGLWWIPDDIAKITEFLNVDAGQINHIQILHLDSFAATMQQNEDDRGLDIDTRRKYNNAFWAQRYGLYDGFGCEFWVPHMLGVSGNVVLLLPNGTTYYYFSDNQEFTWDDAVKESNKLIPLCDSE